MYTSGTTGQFKGVELTNENFITNISDVLSWVEVTHKDKFLSVLPLSHVFERTVGYYIPLLCGATIGYVLDPTKISEVAQAEKPTIIIAVPRLYEKIYLAVKEKAEKSAIKKVLFKIAFDIGKKMERGTLLYQIANLIVFKKIKKAFGGKVRFFVSGAASLQQEIGEFFDALSIPVLEGYGLTETSPIISTNSVKNRKYGTIGKVLPSVQYKIEKGELYVKGPSVFGGYYKQPQKTKEALTSGGWLKTGDLVSEDRDGYLKFDKRKKEIIVLSTGKNIGPAHLEEMMQMSPLINQAFVFGDEKKHVGALIVPEKEKVKGLDKKKLEEEIKKELDRFLNNQVSSYEQVRKFIIIKKPFTVENGMLTPTLKLRRQKIEEVYAEEIEKIYQ
ncbi:MAG: AMP-binding protein [Patescibacteria group bacterium]|nr:AMP-binding protein [Patescibacteria group bacterium]